MTTKPKTKTKEFAPNINDPNEILALGGVSKLLDYYENLVKAVTSKPSASTDRQRPTVVEQLRAGKAFLFAVAKAEYASAAPIDSRNALAERAKTLIDDTIKALSVFDRAENWKKF